MLWGLKTLKVHFWNILTIFWFKSQLLNYLASHFQWINNILWIRQPSYLNSRIGLNPIFCPFFSLWFWISYGIRAQFILIEFLICDFIEESLISYIVFGHKNKFFVMFDRKISPWVIAFCGPRISAHAFPTRWRARFLFEKLWFNCWLRKMTWSRHLFLFYF